MKIYYTTYHIQFCLFWKSVSNIAYIIHYWSTLKYCSHYESLYNFFKKSLSSFVLPFFFFPQDIIFSFVGCGNSATGHLRKQSYHIIANFQMDQTTPAVTSGFGQQPRVWMQPTQYFMHSQWIFLIFWLQWWLALLRDLSWNINCKTFWLRVVTIVS